MGEGTDGRECRVQSWDRASECFGSRRNGFLGFESGGSEGVEAIC